MSIKGNIGNWETCFIGMATASMVVGIIGTIQSLLAVQSGSAQQSWFEHGYFYVALIEIIPWLFLICAAAIIRIYRKRIMEANIKAQQEDIKDQQKKIKAQEKFERFIILTISLSIVIYWLLLKLPIYTTEVNNTNGTFFSSWKWLCGFSVLFLLVPIGMATAATFKQNRAADESTDESTHPYILTSHPLFKALLVIMYGAIFIQLILQLTLALFYDYHSDKSVDTLYMHDYAALAKQNKIREQGGDETEKASIAKSIKVELATFYFDDARFDVRQPVYLYTTEPPAIDSNKKECLRITNDIEALSREIKNSFKPKQNIIIQLIGKTNNIPIASKNPNFSSNHELAQARIENVQSAIINALYSSGSKVAVQDNNTTVGQLGYIPIDWTFDYEHSAEPLNCPYVAQKNQGGDERADSDEKLTKYNHFKRYNQAAFNGKTILNKCKELNNLSINEKDNLNGNFVEINHNQSFYSCKTVTVKFFTIDNMVDDKFNHHLSIKELPQKKAMMYLDFIYFITYTITTTGYGDILPVGSFAKFITIYANLIEVLFLTVMLSLLISHTEPLIKPESESPTKPESSDAKETTH